METNASLLLGPWDLELLRRIAHSADIVDLKNAASGFCDTFGFSRWIYGVAGPDAVLAANNHPQQWIDAYVRDRLHRGRDPVIEAIKDRRRSVHWDLRRTQPLGKPLDTVQRKILADRWEIGARHGVTAPVFNGKSHPFDFGVLSFSREAPLSRAEQLHHEPRVQLFASYFHGIAPAILLPASRRRIALDTLPKLTNREYDCLSWAAKGKTNWEIGRLLNVSSSTIEFHLGNAARKLDARGRIATIAQATRLKLVDPI